MPSSSILTTDEWKMLFDMIDEVQARPKTTQAPIPDKTPIVLRTRCTQAFTRGRQAAKHAEITGPEISDSACDYEQLVLMTYFALGMDAESISHSQPESPPKGKEPDEFDGDRTKYRAFVNQLALCFGSNSSKFNTDKAKISYAASFLRGPAFEWLEPYINEISGEVTCTSYSAFLEGLKAGFADPDAYATAEREIETLSQKHSCSAYYSQFVGIIAQLGWTEDAVKIHYFRQGLKEEIKDMLVGRDLPETIIDFASLCIKLDNQIHARSRERTELKKPRNILNDQFNQKRNSTFESLTTPISRSVGDPMELDATSRKAYRRANNLCTYCGEPGHWVKSCSKAQTKNNKIALAAIGDNGNSSKNSEN